MPVSASNWVGVFLVFCASCTASSTCRAATLSPVPPPVVHAPGATALSAQTNLGFPGSFWAPLLAWDETADIVIDVSVMSPPGDPGQPVSHNLFISLVNMTPDQWNGFEILISGPAQIAPFPPAGLSLIGAPQPIVTTSSITFSSLDWPAYNAQTGLGTTATLAFGLNVFPPINGEPVRFTLRPTAVPEPASLTLLLMALVPGFAQRRRRQS